MKMPGGLVLVVGALAAGAGFGAVTSLTNALASPYSDLGTPLAGTALAYVAGVLSMVLDAGWSWAALAVVAGRLAATPVRGAVVGALVLVAATTAYYLADACFREEPLAWYWSETVNWWAAAGVLGPALGVIGTFVGRPGAAGLLAGLTVPVGAAVQMLVLPLRSNSAAPTASSVAEAIVWTVAAVGAAWAVHRFRSTSGRATALRKGRQLPGRGDRLPY